MANVFAVKFTAGMCALIQYFSLCYDVYQNYELQANSRDALKIYLGENSIGTLIQWGGTAVHQFIQLGFDQRLPNTERFFERCIMLPMNVFISDDDVDYNGSYIQGLNEFLNFLNQRDLLEIYGIVDFGDIKKD